jgi:hypothetical protein
MQELPVGMVNERIPKKNINWQKVKIYLIITLIITLSMGFWLKKSEKKKEDDA